MVAGARRLPGFRFEVESAPLDEALPRMDVALFVGFASSGPIDVPVAVEQIAEFTDIFGADMPLAWDLVRGEQMYSHLGPTVRAFFQNGGTRCWVVRVAGAGAVSNEFPLAGLAQIGPEGLAQARAVARSEGSWSDALTVATSIDRQSMPITAIALAGQTVAIDVTSARGLSIGDLIRLTFRREGHIAFGAIASMAPAPGGATRLTLDPCVWFTVPTETPNVTGDAVFVAASGNLIRRRALTTGVPAWRADAPVTIDLALEPADEVPSGTFVNVTFGNENLAFVAAGTPTKVGTAGSHTKVRLRGSALWRAASAPYSAAAVPLPSFTERLLLELLVQRSDAEPMRLSRLGLAPKHPSFWGSLPTDAAIYEPLADPTLAAPGADVRLPLAPRFPLAGGKNAGFSIPIGDPLLPDFLGAFEQSQPAAARDGLSAFDPAVFLDPRLIDAGTNALLAQAEFVRYQSTRRIEPLHGMHAAFFVDEISIVAVPDAVHRPWSVIDEAHVGPDSPPHVPPEPKAQQPECPPAGDFRRCDPCVLDAPSVSGRVDAAGRIALTWIGDGTSFTLEESVGPEFASWATVATSARRQFDIYDRRPGEYAYRVTAATGDRASPPSAVVFVTIPGRRRAVLDALDDGPYDNRGLLDIQRALLRLCAARGDAVALLGLPEHYREDEAIEHVGALTSPSVGGIRAGRVAPLSTGEEYAFTYGALYHPWLVVTERRVLRRVPPDGAAAGVLARRALSRGAWIAPANDALRAVIALTPSLVPDRRLDLQIDQINVVRQEPRGFVMLSADTLARDADLRPLNVRRLLILLRRAALQLGATYVFEPNDDGFQRMVQRGFEEMLGQLHMRGAFAGATAASSFQVVTDASLNTSRARDQARFFVELRVAPSVPLAFLTIRLVQSGDRLTVTEGR